MFSNNDTVLIGFSAEEIEEYNRLNSYMNNSNDVEYTPSLDLDLSDILFI